MRRVTFDRVELVGAGRAVVQLVVDGTSRRLRIWVGPSEAALISIAATARRAPRPLTHDVLQAVLRGFQLTLERITIAGPYDGLFLAALSVTGLRSVRTIDCRPADAISLALRERAPMYIEETVFQHLQD